MRALYVGLIARGETTDCDSTNSAFYYAELRGSSSRLIGAGDLWGSNVEVGMRNNDNPRLIHA
jgi:hypothetical protein